ncbi:Asp-tRNA(Asn)/Glu-tRNA(Gln) amidotransferase subunit GatC [Hymenobacter latericus]|uniref:Asp-tRNA(Asn)/Glu-tRNA(Gln) amidotransferase subunit GatC n=1 Tax=Hymenobacter sp. YIM 151858-1 TaxID=2987688 RepID=UPI0022265BF4|nr:Asp-tRNA(Asn)/Glu-tRNA(Gln) amidotransferase subunit GatC [Hymenobacter sp. YIM 151858-1]UYZ59237.1 Asp-tRNA(Asn)/Glu-tRNA(Gln) amidotransferase subunit GatC [Hymenobacter sp. YIM 151858-1]
MSTDLNTLRQLAHLARLEFDESNEQQMLNDLNKILDWVEQLRGLDTAAVEPLVHLSHEINVLRPDEPQNTISHAEGLLNAPRKDSDYFRVPKVLE